MIAALLMLLVGSVAAADVPHMPGDPLQATPATEDALSTPALQAAPGLSVGAQLSHARSLISYEVSGEVQSVLAGATSLQLGAVWGTAWGDVGLSLPSYLQLSGDRLETPGGAVGDVGVQVRAPVTPWLSAQLGGTLPTGDADRFAGYGRATGSAAVIAGADAARIRIGYQLTPAVDIGAEPFDDIVRLSGALTPSLGTRWQLSGEVDVQLRRGALDFSTGELLAAGHRRFGWGSLHIGGGAGVLRGPGTPAWRLVVGVRRGPT